VNVVVGIELSPEGRVFSARVEHSNAPDRFDIALPDNILAAKGFLRRLSEACIFGPLLSRRNKMRLGTGLTAAIVVAAAGTFVPGCLSSGDTYEPFGVRPGKAGQKGWEDAMTS
jgi:hypothetical protein